MTKIEKVFFEKNGLCYLAGVEDVNISHAEKSLGIRFFTEYRDYIAKFGVASYEGHELTGICDSKRLSVVAVTLKNRNRDKEVPHDWYVIEELHIDGIVAWQDSFGDVYLKSPTTKAKKICGSLCEYLEM